MESVEELRKKLQVAEAKEKEKMLAIAQRRSQCVHQRITRNEDKSLHECAECGEPFNAASPNQQTDPDRVVTLTHEIDYQQEQLDWHTAKKEELQRTLIASRDLRKELCPHYETRRQFRTTISEYTPGYGLDCQFIGSTEFVKDTEEEIMKIASYETVYVEWICSACNLRMKSQEVKKQGDEGSYVLAELGKV